MHAVILAVSHRPGSQGDQVTYGPYLSEQAAKAAMMDKLSQIAARQDDCTIKLVFKHLYAPIVTVLVDDQPEATLSILFRGT